MLGAGKALASFVGDRDNLHPECCHSWQSTVEGCLGAVPGRLRYVAILGRSSLADISRFMEAPLASLGNCNQSYNCILP